MTANDVLRHALEAGLHKAADGENLRIRGDAAQVQQWAERLTDYALAMVAAERRRIRRRPAGPSTPAATP